MDIIFVVSLAIAVTVATWFGMRAVKASYLRYQSAFQTKATASLGEFFLFLDASQLWSLNAALCCALTLVTYLLFQSFALCLLAGLVALALPPRLVVYLRRHRMAKFDQQLPDFLLALAGALRAGQGMQQAVRHIVEQAQAPLAQEFGLMLREQRMGVGFEDALSNLYVRMPTESTGLMVSSLKIAAHSGGNLAEALERLAQTMRSRLQLLGRIRALTSQGQLQAWIMACLPFALALVLDWLDPQSMALLWHSSAGWMVLGLIALLECAGVMLIRKIVRIDV